MVRPRVLLRLEGLAVAAASVVAYAALGGSWLLFALLVLAPDLSMVGYLTGPRVGAATYNVVHTVVGPVALLGAGWFLGVGPAVSVALVWLAHIGVDRLFGFGLKSPEGFDTSHLARG